MIFMHRMIHSISLSLVGTVTLVGMMPIALAASRKTPKTPDVVQPSVPGGKRGPGCEVGGPETFLPIGPTQKIEGVTKAVVTTSDAMPMLWIHVPHAVTDEKPGYFQIKIDGEYFSISKVVTNKAGAIGMRLPQKYAMKTDTVLEWRFMLQCTSDASTSNPIVFGQIQLKPLSARVKQDLAKTQGKPDQQAKLYSANGFWLDSVTIVGQERFNKPNNATMAKEWDSLLTREGMREIGKSSIVQLIP
jgi:Domain of Unknown Function (DUF928)